MINRIRNKINHLTVDIAKYEKRKAKLHMSLKSRDMYDCGQIDAVITEKKSQRDYLQFLIDMEEGDRLLEGFERQTKRHAV